MLRVLRIHEDLPPLLLALTSAALGSFGWVVIAWILAMLHLLTPIPVLLAFIAVPLLLLPDSRYWWRMFRRAEWNAEGPAALICTVLLWFLLSYLALNFLNVVRPFPIGWDDLGSYLNRPKLLASYGAFIPQMPTFQWEYITALPFALFGSDSITGATLALEVNWLAGVFAVLATYAVGRLMFGRGAGLTAATLYYTLPMVGHFSFADMKIDNASYFISAACILLTLVALFGVRDSSEPPQPRISLALLFVAGILGGFAFGIKPTAVLTLFMVSSFIAGGVYGWWGFAGWASVCTAVLTKTGPLSVPEVLRKVGISLGISDAAVNLTALLFFFGLGVILLGIAAARAKSKEQLFSLARSFVAFGIGFFLSVIPWMSVNLWSNGTVSVAGALKFNDDLAPYITYLQEEDVPASLDPRVDTRFLTPDLALDPEDPACMGNARVEELDRYWGFGDGWSHYLTLPWRAVMNADIVGYYVTLVPALLLFPLILFLPFFWRPEAKWLRFLAVGSCIFLAQWTLVANGIIWYGIGMFLGIVVVIEALAYRAPDASSRYLTSGLIVVSIIIALLNRMWQFDVQKNLFEYPLGKSTAETIREVTIPHYDDIRDYVLDRYESMPERPYTYRMGTFISYFIPKNKEIIPNADNQLQFFNCINQERDHQLTLRRLQQLGFNGMIFDTNTATIEKDPNGSLHQKVNAFVDFLNDASLGLDIVVNDPQGGIVYVLLP